MTKTIRLTSSSLVHTPGIVQWAERLEVNTFEKDYANRLLRIGFFAEAFPKAPAEVLLKLADGEYTVEGDTVLVEVRVEQD